MAFYSGWRGPNIVRDGLLLYYDAGSPNSYYSPLANIIWKDISGNGFNGLLLNGPSYTASFNGSIVFDGTNDYATASLNLTGSQGTISCWVFPKASNSNFFTYTTNNAASVYTHQLGLTSDNKLNAYIYDGAIKQFTSSLAVTLNTWNNAVFYWNDGNSYGAYLNGSFIGSASLATSYKSGASFWIGSNTGTFSNSNGYLNGNISNMQIHNRVLSATEILQNYNVLKDRFGL